MTPIARLRARTHWPSGRPEVAAGECQASYCLSEPTPAVTSPAMTTRAVRDGDHYVLNGRKVWITNAGV